VICLKRGLFHCKKIKLWADQWKWILPWCKQTVPLWAWHLTNTHSESTSVALNCKKWPIHNGLYYMRSMTSRAKILFLIQSKSTNKTICLWSSDKPWCQSNQASTSKTISMYVKLSTANLSHLRKLEPILVYLRNSKHFKIWRN